MVETKRGKAKVFHFRDVDFAGKVTNTGGATFAFVQNGDSWLYSVARCSWRDNFSKKIGRDIAIGRLEKGCKVHEYGKDNPRYEDVARLYEYRYSEFPCSSNSRAELPFELRSLPDV